MLTPSQIAEMAEKKYPLMETKHVMGQLKECIELHNQTQLDRREGYIAAFTDAMELMSKEWLSVEEYDLLKQQLNNVRDTATQYIRKQEYNKHYLPHLYNARVFTGSVILEIANDFKALVLPELPELTKDKKI